MKKAIVIILCMIFLCSCGQQAQVPTESPSPSGSASPSASASASPSAAATAQTNAEITVTPMSDPLPEHVPPADPVTEGSKTYQFFVNNFAGAYILKTRISSGDDGIERTTAVKDGKMAIIINSEGRESRSITKDGKQYETVPGQKQYFVMDQQVEMAPSEDGSSFAEGATMLTGQMEIGGKKYTYEAYEEMGGYTRYCFEGDQLKYIVQNADSDNPTIEEVLEYTNNVPDEFFEVPEDYVLLNG